MNDFWEKRYANQEYVYGKQANAFIQETLDNLNPGTILFPAEGEGRNAVYAAQKGWETYAFDLSTAGKKKALKLAKEKSVQITYDIKDMFALDYAPDTFDAIVLCFAHTPPDKRQAFHRSLISLLKPNGLIILEGFSRDHARFQKLNPKAGGPGNIEMLFTESRLADDFQALETILLEQVVTNLSEGKFHVGTSSVIRFIGRKT